MLDVVRGIERKNLDDENKEETGKLSSLDSTVFSESILATFVSADGIEHQFKIGGRGTSVIGGGLQGDHVTSYGLVARGITRHLQNVIINRAEDLEKLRSNRDIILQYINNIANIDTDFLEKSKEILKIAFKRYNSRRFSKTTLYEQIEGLEKKLDETKKESDILRELEKVLSPDYKTKVLELITIKDQYIAQEYAKYKKYNEEVREKAYIANCYAMCDEISQIARGVLTQYNHIPNTSFVKYGSPAGAEQGALAFLDNNPLKDIHSNTRKTQINTRILEIAQKINDLFYYPEIGDKKHKQNIKIIEDKNKLREWQKSNGSNKSTPLSTSALPRTNNLETLVEVTTRHLLIIFAVYPNLMRYQEEIMDVFLNTFIKESWPDLDDEKKAKKKYSDTAVTIKRKIKANVVEIQNNAENILKDENILEEESSREENSLIGMQVQSSYIGDDTHVSRLTAERQDFKGIPASNIH